VPGLPALHATAACTGEDALLQNGTSRASQAHHRRQPRPPAQPGCRVPEGAEQPGALLLVGESGSHVERRPLALAVVDVRDKRDVAEARQVIAGILLATAERTVSALLAVAVTHRIPVMPATSIR